MRHSRFALLVFFTILTAPAVATSEPAPRRFDGAHAGLELSVGARTPVGTAGLSVVVAPRPWLAFEVGAGLGFSGPQVSALARYSAGPVVSLAAGISTGPFEIRHAGRIAVDHKEWARADWANVELSFASRLRNQQLRAFVGYSRMLPTSVSCAEIDDTHVQGMHTSHPCDGEMGKNLLYVGIGYRFAAHSF